MGKLIVFLAFIAVAAIMVSSATAKFCDPYICGDVNDDGYVNILDVAAMIDCYNCYQHGIEYCNEIEEWFCSNASDVNGDGAFKADDIQYLIDYLYHGGPAPLCNY